MSGDGLLLLDFSDLHGMDPLAAVHAGVLVIRLGVDLGLEEPDILKFGGENQGGGGGRVEEGGWGGRVGAPVSYIGKIGLGF
jgi:hypothetical protein